MHCDRIAACNWLLHSILNKMLVHQTHPSPYHITLRQRVQSGEADWFVLLKRGLLGQIPRSSLAPGLGHACPPRAKSRAPRAPSLPEYPHLCPSERRAAAIFDPKKFTYSVASNIKTQLIMKRQRWEDQIKTNPPPTTEVKTNKITKK